MSESPVPDIPLATPEGSDDEDNKKKLGGGGGSGGGGGAIPIGSPSMVSIDRDEEEIPKSGDRGDGNPEDAMAEQKTESNGMKKDIDEDGKKNVRTPEPGASKPNDGPGSEENGPQKAKISSANYSDKIAEEILPFLPPVPKYGGAEPPPYWGSIKQLYCRTGYHLAICPNGKVEGVRDEYHPYGKLSILFRDLFTFITFIYNFFFLI